MDYQATDAKMKDLKRRARTARKEGKREQAESFAAGARRLQRKLRGLEKPEPASGTAETDA